ncbi:MAG: tetratricopeptide repeat protein [Betaproteobacteria bacterium]|nr:tetratricopeptide repeat protein [Betaproteobacteria bacterium]
MKNRICSILPLLAAALLAHAATATLAQTVDDAERCASITGNPDVAIQHCTRAIESKRHTGEELAKLYFNRGIEWAAKGDYDRAIADFDASLRLAPRNVDALYSRGSARSNKGDHDRAVADFNAAIGLNPKDPAAFSGRAHEWTAKGDYEKAIADYDTAIRLDPKASVPLLARGRVRLYTGDHARAVSDLEQSLKLDYNEYTALWLYLARKRGGAPDAEERLDAETRASRGSSWPAPVIVLFLGRTDPDSVLAAATDQDARRQREQRCEANFYLAHWHLLRGNSERALPLLQEAQRSCPREFLEHEGAVAELRRLQKP